MEIKIKNKADRNKTISELTRSIDILINDGFKFNDVYQMILIIRMFEIEHLFTIATIDDIYLILEKSEYTKQTMNSFIQQKMNKQYAQM